MLKSAKKFLLCCFASPVCIAVAQQADTLRQLDEVEVNAYFESRSLMRTPGSASVIGPKQLGEQPDQSLVPALNSVAGVRMEERSPGSYRLSIRGSLLRSPFGIRNVKIYMDDFPLTDAGGNSYLNMLDAGQVSRVEILKGPEASIFGANSGGVIFIDPVNKKADSNFISAGVSGGSYGMLHEKTALQKHWKNVRVSFAQGFQRSDGYRDNSALQRHYLQTFEQWNYAPRAQLKAFALFSSMQYLTPGGLTLQQFQSDPRAARPATSALPGASAQKAGIYNQTVFGGLSHTFFITQHIRHVIALFGSHTDFENPFITNYEVRAENSIGARTYIEVSSKRPAYAEWKWQTGGEIQQTSSHITNYGNQGGMKDTLQASDDITAEQHFFFTRFSVDLNKRWIFEAALSLNDFQYQYRNLYPLMEPASARKTFEPQLMPRIALSYVINPFLTWRASASRGYSAPTIAEIRPSDNIIYTNLQPESGWNYETGFRIQDKQQWIWIDACTFYYQLQQAIVRRTNSAGVEYFINAGGTQQWGIEAQVNLWLLKPGNYFLLRSVQLRNSYTFNHFLFANYMSVGSDYSGNRLTGVPANTNVTGMSIQIREGFYLFTQYNYTAGIPLNDANSVYAAPYHLMQLKAGWQRNMGRYRIELFAGADNVLNASYSLGNDLNAAAGRYYNPAPLRNYYGGINLVF